MKKNPSKNYKYSEALVLHPKSQRLLCIVAVLRLIRVARLPLFQGATTVYTIPLLLMSGVDDTFCTGREPDPRIGNLVLKPELLPLY